MYKRGMDVADLLCVSQEQDMKIMREVHEGVCGGHPSWRTLSHKILRAGFYWPSLMQDAKDCVSRCVKYQKFANDIHLHSREQQPINASYPFA